MFEQDEITNLGKRLKLRILRTKKKLISANDTFKMFTGEYDSPSKDELRLSKKVYENKGGMPETVATGTAQKLREMFPDLKVATIVYGITNGKLVRLTVKGASTTGDTGLYEYLDSFNGAPTFMVETKIESKLIQKNRAISYNRMEFSKGEASEKDLDVVEGYLDMINGVVHEDVEEAPIVIKKAVASPEKVHEDFEKINDDDAW
jgi:hypothetical protein